MSLMNIYEMNMSTVFQTSNNVTVCFVLWSRHDLHYCGADCVCSKHRISSAVCEAQVGLQHEVNRAVSHRTHCANVEENVLCIWTAAPHFVRIQLTIHASLLSISCFLIGFIQQWLINCVFYITSNVLINFIVSCWLCRRTKLSPIKLYYAIHHLL